jgi:hypothetical protein
VPLVGRKQRHQLQVGCNQTRVKAKMRELVQMLVLAIICVCDHVGTAILQSEHSMAWHGILATHSWQSGPDTLWRLQEFSELGSASNPATQHMIILQGNNVTWHTP